MVKVSDKVRIFSCKKCVVVEALFNTGSGRSYVSDRIAQELGYELYDKPRRVQLAVKDLKAEVIGYVPAVDLEIAGYMLPSKETLDVIKDLFVDAIIGLNIIEPYGITFERDRIRFKEYPPRTYLI